MGCREENQKMKPNQLVDNRKNLIRGSCLLSERENRLTDTTAIKLPIGQSFKPRYECRE